MFDSDEAAHIATVTGWVSRQGRFYGEAERLARYDGCTHDTCECGNEHEKHLACCNTCRDEHRLKRYNAMPFKEWDGETPLAKHEDDRYFFSEDDLLDYCDSNDVDPEDLRLVICQPNYAHEITGEYFSDDLPEDQDIGDVWPELADAIEKANELIRKRDKPLSWSEGKFRTEYRKKQIDA